MLKRPREPPTNNCAVDYQTPESDHVLKRPKPFAIKKEVNIFPVISSDDLPKTVVANLNQGSSVKSMDFHPLHPTYLLVGMNTGDIAIWEVGFQERLVFCRFKVWDIGKCTKTLQATLASGNTASVNRAMWSPDGALFGVAYSKHIVHIYSYYGGGDLQNHLELDAHAGNVSDIAFANPVKKLCIVTCGEDKTIKVWDTADGTKCYIFEGHGAPVYSLCPHFKENIQYIFSTDIDGKIKAWLYDNKGPRLSYDAPGNACTTMAYSGDKTRLFSCGTSKDGESFIVEWDEREGIEKRRYQGLGKKSVGLVQFDASKRVLVVGDEFAVKFWDMDHINVLETIDAGGDLPASPNIRLSKEGSLLAVSTSENGVKILASTDGSKLIRSNESRSMAISSRNTLGSAVKNEDGQTLQKKKSIITDNIEKSKIWKLAELGESSQLRSLRLPDSLPAVRISRLIYTSCGGAILTLASNAVHKLWRWKKNDENGTRKADINILPHLMQPSSGILMTNDMSETNLEETVPCFAISKNESYLVSASGGKVSLYNMLSFKTMATFMDPPPAATVLAFHPEDNNFIAIGMEDSSILIKNINLHEVKSELRGHQKRVTGLAFSNVLKVLVSSGADAQLCVWGMDGWDRLTSRFLKIPSGRNPSPLAQTRVQFHQDQVHVLVVRETHLAIYKAPKLDRINQWVPQGSRVPITDATYSCDGQSIYACFENGSVSILGAATLIPRCRISPTAYLTPGPSSKVHPLVVAAHPMEPNQIALGLSDGGVQILEPLEGEGKWGTKPPIKYEVDAAS